jgi:penicillin amidase
MSAPVGGARAHGLRRLARRGAVVVAVVAAGALALDLGLGALRARREAYVAQPRMEGELRVPGLTAPVEISRDARGIPHVEAASESDALFGLGFVQAQDRVGQMIWLRASALGRAAELVGEGALAADREARTLGIGLLAQAQVVRLEPAARAALEAYASGVNACLSRLRSGEDPLPLALRGIESALEPWTPADTIAVLKLQAFALGSSMRVSVLLSELIETLGGIGSQPYFPEPPRGLPKAPAALPGVAALPASRSPLDADPLRAATGLDARGAGSSVFVVGARRSASGRPLVAGDSHAEPTVPARFYEAHVRGGDLDVAGATLPGAPVVFSGHNRRIAWASSFAPAVVTDLYVESLSKDGKRYHDGRALTPLLERVENISVRGGRGVELRVRATRHGPLVNDLLEGEHPPLALSWTGAFPGDGVTGLLQAAHATSAAEFRSALRLHHEPVLAFGYGDAQGVAGIQLAGFLPRRGLPTGLVPVPGRTEDYDWHGSVPFELLPEESADGAAGFAVASDGRMGVASADDIEWLWLPGATAARLRELLAAGVAAGPLDVRALAVLQLDVDSPSALALVRQALALAGEPSDLGAEGRDVTAALSRWDGRMASDSVGAAVYQVFVQRLTQELLVQRLGEGLARRYQALPQTYPVQVVAGILEAVLALPAAGDTTRSEIETAVRRSLRESWLWLLVSAGPNREKWAWGRLHLLQFRPLGLFPKPAVTKDLGLGPFAYGGDALTVNAGGYDLLDPFEVRVASTHRFAIDAAQLDQALSALVPGQSEHPGSPHLSDAVAGWIEGRPRLLLTSRLLIEEATRTRLVLRP